ncbi:MAG: monovalent cation/H(+) antiporter subunit G [Firmicutes bacterium]|nr:monovalent cation/H(+) antiporter subunit G [Bacillota bacterium]
MAYFSSLLIILGIFFFCVGVIGLLRFPDVYTRLHATTKCDTLGAGLVLLGLALQTNFFTAIKLLLLIIFIWLTNPTGAHIIAKVAYLRNTPMTEGSFFKDFTQGGQNR